MASYRHATVPALRGLRTAQLADALSIDRSPSDLGEVGHAQVHRIAQHLSGQLSAHRYQRARWDDPRFWNVEASAEARSQYFAVGCAVNFRFWRLQDGAFLPATGAISGERYRGAMYMWRCLRRALDTGTVDILNPTVLSDLSDAAFDVIFTDDDGINPLDVGRADRLENLRDLGARLASDWDGSFLNVAVASEGSLSTFARTSRTFRAFDDPVYKLTMVNAILHMGSEVYGFADEPLPAIDYHLLRHALRQGMVRPIPPLAAKLREHLILEPDEAQAMRRLALVAFVDLAELSGLSGEIIDNRYWLNRTNCGDAPVCLDPRTAAACPFLDACPQLTEFALPLELTRYY